MFIKKYCDYTYSIFLNFEINYLNLEHNFQSVLFIQFFFFFLIIINIKKIMNINNIIYKHIKIYNLKTISCIENYYIKI